MLSSVIRSAGLPAISRGRHGWRFLPSSEPGARSSRQQEKLGKITGFAPTKKALRHNRQPCLPACPPPPCRPLSSPPCCAIPGAVRCAISRISVTDRCNFRCTYCMPKEVFGKDHVYLPRSALLDFEEITRLARLFIAHGVGKIRLTGGEPLLRKDLGQLIRPIGRADHFGGPALRGHTHHQWLAAAAPGPQLEKCGFKPPFHQPGQPGRCHLSAHE